MLFTFLGRNYALAQSPFCASHDLLEKDSTYKQSYEQINQSIFEYAKQYYSNNSKPENAPPYTIPVVVHLIIPPGIGIGNGNNLTDAQVANGLELLNQSFANSSVFKTTDGVDMGISFCLAKRDPLGKPTNGITRNESSLVAEVTPCTPFGTNANSDAAIKALNNWDCKQYLNIWLVTDLYNTTFGCGLAGYAYFPGAGCNIDGIVQESRYWISVGGTTVTAHEVGHYFSLNHTFSGGCGANLDCLLEGDQVCDTPPDNSSSFAPCSTNSCATDIPDLPDDNTNYMDYTSCTPPHFTLGQKVRAIAGLEKGRTSLITSLGCLSLIDLDIALLKLEVNNVSCTHDFAPVITFKNNGLRTITSFTITYTFNAGAAINIPWTGTLLANQVGTFTFPNQLLGIGTFVTSVTLVNPNGNVDDYLNNNDITITFDTYPIPTLSLVSVTGTHCKSDGTVTLAGMGGTLPYLYQNPGNGFVQNNGLFELLLPGIQKFILTDFNKCADTITVSVPDSCNITTPNEFILNKDARYLGGDCYLLTPAQQTKVGSIWYNKKINLNNDFITEFDMNLGCIDVNGADGIAFVLQPISTAIGVGGGSLGYGGVQPSLVVEFDTWQNCCDQININSPTIANDPAQDHVAIMRNGNVNHFAPDNLAGPIDIITGTNAEDCKFHNIRITWSASQKKITVFVDCKQKISYQGDIINTIFKNDPLVYLGFTASTGGAVNVQQICLKYVSFLDSIPDQTICTGSKIQISAAPNFKSYKWSPTTGISNPNIQNPLFSPTSNTTYTVTMNDSCGFVIKDTFDLNVVTLDFDLDTTNLNACSANPLLKLKVKNGVTGASYSINSNIFNPSGSFFDDYRFNYNQNYIIYAKFGNCTISKIINIAPPKPLRDSLIFQESVLCNRNGMVKIVGLDGKAPYTYNINAGVFQPNGTFNNLTAGMYDIRIKDDNGCEILKKISIGNIATKIDLKIDSAKLVKDCFDDKTLMAVTATGTTPFYYYAMDKLDYDANNIFRNLNAGVHRIIARDDYGCISDSIIFNIIDNTSKPIKNNSVQLCFGQTYTFNGKTYTSTGIYQDTFKNKYGCDSIVITDLKITNSISNTITKTVCNGEKVDIGSKTYDKSGTYSNTLTSVSGCDSIILLQLTVLPLSTNTIKSKLCAPQTFKYNSKTYTITGIFGDTLRTSFGCDSIITLDLIFNNPTTKSISPQICTPNTFIINSKTYTKSGIYTDTLTKMDGCDSIIITNLTIAPAIKNNINKTICFGKNYTLNGKTYSKQGIYSDTLKASLNCDSILVLDLTILPLITNNIIKTICNGEIEKIGTSTYNTSGIYTNVLTSKDGCDSTVNLQLTVRPPSTNTIFSTLCAPKIYSFNSKSYNKTGIFKDTLKTNFGCDSIITLDLIFNAPRSTNTSPTICAPNTYSVGSKTYSKSGIYIDTLKKTDGCDSIITTNLIIHPIKNTSLIQNICKGESYTLNGKTYTITGIYKDTIQSFFGCDSILTLTIKVNNPSFIKEQKTICENENIIINSVKLNKTGIYDFKLKNQFGCDSTLTLDLTVLDTSIIYQEYLLCVGDSIRIGNIYYNKVGNYKDLLQSIRGCDSTLNIKINNAGENFCEDKYCKMYIPNVFTPNNDNQNDFFEAKTNVAIFNEMQIFDRWGNLQYEEKSTDPKWNGISRKGEYCEPAVYIYIIRGFCGNGVPFLKSGDVTLVR